MKPACPRLFEVEALRDGRLAGAELARFQTHLAACSFCTREARALRALAEALRAPSAGVSDELHLRRERTRLLAAFNASLVRVLRTKREQPIKKAFGAALALAALCCAGLIFGLTLWRAHSATARVESAPEPVVIRADSNAKWSRQVEHQVERVTLESGALSIRVNQAAPERRLLVILPDGELEDIGTTFSVSAHAGHTTRVTVQDGSVVLRLHGKAPLVLGAGDSWTPAPVSVAAPVVASERPVVAPLRSTRPAPSAAVSPLPEPEPDPSADFRAAMQALNGGDSARAAALFSAFISDYPRDSRGEDAAYLRVLALQRAGNSSAMRQAAADYLSRYPRGFRRAEVEQLSASR